MQWLTNELQQSASKGHVLQFSEVWNRYCEIALKADVNAPLSYQSRRATFKEKFQIYAQDFP